MEKHDHGCLSAGHKIMISHHSLSLSVFLTVIIRIFFVFLISYIWCVIMKRVKMVYIGMMTQLAEQKYVHLYLNGMAPDDDDVRIFLPVLPW